MTITVTAFERSPNYGDSALNQPSLPRVVLRTRLGAALAGTQRPLGGALEPRQKRLVAERTPDALGRAQAGQRRGICGFVEELPERRETLQHRAGRRQPVVAAVTAIVYLLSAVSPQFLLRPLSSRIADPLDDLPNKVPYVARSWSYISRCKRITTHLFQGGDCPISLLSDRTYRGEPVFQFTSPNNKYSVVVEQVEQFLCGLVVAARKATLARAAFLAECCIVQLQ